MVIGTSTMNYQAVTKPTNYDLKAIELVKIANRMNIEKYNYVHTFTERE